MGNRLGGNTKDYGNPNTYISHIGTKDNPKEPKNQTPNPKKPEKPGLVDKNVDR